MIISTFPIADISPNPWNPNRMTDGERLAIRQSLLAYGFVAPLVCRQLSGGRTAKVQIIDGEHRFETFQALIEEYRAGFLSLPDESHAMYVNGQHPLIAHLHPAVAPVVNLGTVSDAMAKKLTVVLTETRGEPSMHDLARLLVELSDGLTIQEQMNALPYTETEMAELLALGASTFDPNAADDLGGGMGGDGDSSISDEWVSFEVRMTQEDFETFKDAKRRTESDTVPATDEKVANGHAVYALSAHYLAG